MQLMVVQKRRTEAVLLQAARSLLGAAMERVQEAGDDARLRRIGNQSLTRIWDRPDTG